MAETDSAHRTRYMARALGLFLLVFGAGVALRATSLYLLVPSFFQDAALTLVTAVFAMALGAAMIAAHNRWNSLAAIVVSVFGWVTFIRGAVLLFAPELIAQIASHIARIQIFPVIAGLVAALIGAWLCFVGWFAKGHES
jgi:threonine/homoserine/homoserine lactone efflux protein